MTGWREPLIVSVVRSVRISMVRLVQGTLFHIPNMPFVICPSQIVRRVFKFTLSTTEIAAVFSKATSDHAVPALRTE